jgi:hypothetical protein
MCSWAVNWAATSLRSGLRARDALKTPSTQLIDQRFMTAAFVIGLHCTGATQAPTSGLSLRKESVVKESQPCFHVPNTEFLRSLPDF